MVNGLWILLGIALVVALWWGSCVILIRLSVRQRPPSFAESTRWPRDGCVPVFMYHVVDPTGFLEDVEYLRRNGYETIGLDDLVSWLDGEQVDLPTRPVLLTFDDGHESVFTAAYPLLREMGLRATVFVCPWWVSEEARDPEVGRRNPFSRTMNWNQLAQLDRSGVFDVQAHTHNHHRIWVDSAVEGFVTPQTPNLMVDWTDELTPECDPNPPLGWPILRYGPRFGHRRRFFPDLEVFERCASHVAEQGGPSFFDRAGWRVELDRIVDNGESVGHVPGRRETVEEQAEAMRDDLLAAKNMLEQRLDKRVIHLAFPWNESSLMATNIAADVGFRSICRRIVNLRDVCVPGDDPLYIPRVPAGDAARFVRCVPGRGRHGPATLVWRKIARRWH